MSPCWGTPQQGLPILVFHRRKDNAVEAILELLIETGPGDLAGGGCHVWTAPFTFVNTAEETMTKFLIEPSRVVLETAFDPEKPVYLDFGSCQKNLACAGAGRLLASDHDQTLSLQVLQDVTRDHPPGGERCTKAGHMTAPRNDRHQPKSPHFLHQYQFLSWICSDMGRLPPLLPGRV